MILLAAATFFISKTPVTELQQAHQILEPLLGGQAAIIFAVALLFAGLASTITSGMAAGSIFAGMYKEPFDIKDSHSKLGVIISLVLATIIIFLISNPFKGLIFSQMLLSMQLPVTIFLQVYLTSSEKVMGKYKNTPVTRFMLYTVGAIVTALNVALLISLTS
jgi:manganese transport protein